MSALNEFVGMVNRLQSAEGLSRRAATARVVRENPELHRRMLEGANLPRRKQQQQRRDAVLASARRMKDGDSS